MTDTDASTATPEPMGRFDSVAVSSLPAIDAAPDAAAPEAATPEAAAPEVAAPKVELDSLRVLSFATRRVVVASEVRASVAGIRESFLTRKARRYLAVAASLTSRGERANQKAAQHHDARATYLERSQQARELGTEERADKAAREAAHQATIAALEALNREAAAATAARTQAAKDALAAADATRQAAQAVVTEVSAVSDQLAADHQAAVAAQNNGFAAASANATKTHRDRLRAIAGKATPTVVSGISE